MKIVTVVGARPQFIKAGSVSAKLRAAHAEILVHTGQHFDDNMSAVFFRELGIPAPDYNLGISGGTHAEMTGKMLPAIEKLLLLEEPGALLVYGDTNSTLAAVKLRIPVFHVEAGNRMGTLDNPEEANRVLADHCSALLFCATEEAKRNLAREGLADRTVFVGNVMYDSFLRAAGLPWDRPGIVDFDGNRVAIPERYYYMTCHRQENTYSDRPLGEIMEAMNSLDAPTIYPVHPRNREMARRLLSSRGFGNILLTQPVGYLDSVHLTKNALKIVTDSGGLQCEAFYAGVQCVCVFDRAVWPETMVGNRNQLARPDREDILEKLSAAQTVDPEYRPFGDGHAAEAIARAIGEWSDLRCKG